MQRGTRGTTRLVTRKSGRRWRIAGAAGAVVLVLAFGAQVADAHTGTVGEWRFDEAGGQTAVDGGPFGLDGRLGTSAGVDAADPQRIPGVASGALRFGGGSYVQLPDAAELAQPTLSVEAVVRAPTSPGAYRYIVSRGGQGCFAGSYGLYTAKGGGVAFYAFDGSGYVVSAAARASDVWNGGWHHIAGTFDGGRLRLYVDGRPVGDPSDGPTRIDWSRTSPTAAIGRYVGSCDLTFAGDMDMVRLWQGALSASAVAANATQELRLTTPVDPAGPPLTPAAPPTRVAATPPARPRSATPGAPVRACSMGLSRRKVVVRRRTTVRVKVTVRGRPQRSVRVVARAAGRKLGSARTGRSGKARLVLRARKIGKVRIKAAVSPSCSPGVIKVVRR
jgi:concanavalin A-like lectin/glucanase superfamily protein